ncbi:VOC family protein [Kitasatospora sp. NPDC058444]|uniref:VOC family protein n=1 Tax=Kitasatospora sp. NPDC058444 TaxID=3346504 RepID=UPI003662B2B0
MDAPYPRLLVTRFAECFGFYRAVLTPLAGATLAKGTPEGPYAGWDLADRTFLALFDRSAMAATLGTADLPAQPAAPSQDTAMLVLRVDDVDGALALCLRHGGTPVTPPTDRPEWGPTLRSAHLRDPDGRVIELQSY